MLITGWGMGTTPLEPLSHALQQQGYRVTVHDIFNPHQIPASLINCALNADILIGWSLGGQLAMMLSAYLLQHDQQEKKVITLASNPCFVASKDWLYAMPKSVFQQFEKQYLQDPQTTLKQFYFNICRGDAQAKTQWQTLLEFLPVAKHELYVNGLTWLRQLNVLDVLATVPSHHIFAQHDQLVPIAVAHALSENVSYEIMNNMSHSFPVFYATEVAQRIQHYLHNR